MLLHPTQCDHNRLLYGAAVQHRTHLAVLCGIETFGFDPVLGPFFSVDVAATWQLPNGQAGREVITPIPEPSCLVLLGAGLLVGGVLRKRFRLTPAI
jgi:hypothetical protein